MLEPTLFIGLDSQVSDRVHDLYAAADEVRPRGAHRDRHLAGTPIVARARGSVGRFLVSLGSQVAGQPQV